MTQVAAPVRQPVVAPPTQPFKGLAAYEEIDRLLFFGRERDRKIVAANLRSSRLTLLYGPSGVGKSSLLGAGVLADLCERAEAAVDAGQQPKNVPVLVDEWGGDPVARLAGAVRDAVRELHGDELAEQLPENGDLSETLEAWSEVGYGVLLVILDQFEEYFVSHPDEDGEGTFAVEFPRAVNRRELRVHFLVSIREDTLARLDRFKGRIPSLFSNRLRIEHLTREAAREAIVRPVERFSAGEVEADEDLVEEVLDQVAVGQVRLKAESGGAGDAAAGLDAAQDRIEAPYLQLVMERIWLAERGAPGEEPRSDKLRRSTFVDELGGARRIAHDYLEESMGGFTRRERELAAGAFRFLVTSSAAKIVWSTVGLAEVLNADKDELEPVLDRLAAYRILRPVDPLPDRPDEPRFEIFHDVLATEVLDWRREWERQLAERKRRKLVLAVVALAMVAAALALGALWAFSQKSKAEDARRDAEAAEGKAVAQELAASSIARLGVDPMKSIQLALEAVVGSEGRPDRAAENALRQALSESREERRFVGHEDWVTGAQFSDDGSMAVTSSLDGTVRVWETATGRTIANLSGVTGSFVGASFDSTGERVLAAADANRARIWNVETEKELVSLRGHHAALTSAEFSPDGRRAVTASEDGTARIWNAETGLQLAKLPHRDSVRAAHFSADGNLVVTSSDDRRARIWDAQTGSLVRTLSHPGVPFPAATFIKWNPVWDAELSSDGRLVATGSEDGNVRIWRVEGDAAPRILRGHTGRIGGVEFSSDGGLLLSWGDKTARLWSTDLDGTGDRILRHRDAVETATFSHDGNLVATASQDGAITVWSVHTGDKLIELRGHRDTAVSLDFGPGDATLLTASVDRTARTWDIGGGEVLRGHAGWVITASYSPDGERIVTAGEDGVPRVWRHGDGGWRSRALRGYLEHSGLISDATFSPDGSLIVTTGFEDWSANVWDSSGSLLTWLGNPWAHQGGTGSGAFDPSSRYIVTAGADATARIWRAPTSISDSRSKAMATLSGHEQLITQAVFSPDGTRIATASLDGTARIWEWETWQKGGTKEPPLVIEAGGLVWGIAFLPETGEQVVTAGGDGTAQLWDSATGEPVGRSFEGHVGKVASVAFSSDGQLLLTAGSDLSIRVWDVGSGRLLSLIRPHGDLVNSAVFSPDDTMILSASDDGTARISRCATCGSVPELVKEAESRLRAVGIELKE